MGLIAVTLFHDLHSAWNTRPQSAFYKDRISNIASERSHYLKTEYITVKTRAYFWKRKYFLLLQIKWTLALLAY